MRRLRGLFAHATSRPRSRADRALTAVGAVAVAVIAIGATALATISLAQSDERTLPAVRRSWPGALERQTFRVVPAEATIESLGREGVLALFDELMQGEPAWGQGAFVYFFGRHAEPYMALHESLVALGEGGSQRAADCIERALANCEKLTGLNGTDASAYFADYDRRRDRHKEWIVQPATFYTAWNSRKFRAAIANTDAASRAAWVVARLCARVWNDPALRSTYGKRVRALAATIVRNVVRNPHYSIAFDPTHNGTHVWSGQIAPRNALTLLDLGLVLDDRRLRHRGLILAKRIRRAINRFSAQMPQGDILLTSLDCVQANTTDEAWAGLETWGRRMTDGHGHTFCAPSDTSHLNAYVALITECHERGLVFSDWYIGQAVNTLRGMWVDAEQPMEAYDRSGTVYLISEQFTDYPGRRLVTILADPHRARAKANIPGALGRNICPGWVGLVTATLDDPAHAQDAVLQELAGILPTMPMRSVSGYSVPAFLGYCYRFAKPARTSPSASPTASASPSGR